MKSLSVLFCIAFCATGLSNPSTCFLPALDTPLMVHRCNDFTISGTGDNPEWYKAQWTTITKIDEGGKENKTRFRILYSATGLYVFFTGNDEKITSSFRNDFENLFKADVFEVFFHPNPAEGIYFEYEVSPLDKELVLLILNMNGKFGSWMPWHYEGKNKVVKKVSITGGKMEPDATIQSWSAELFFPYQLLTPLKNVPPLPGDKWNANFCRLDYDSGHMIKWSWSPIAVSFHEINKYFSIQFE